MATVTRSFTSNIFGNLIGWGISTFLLLWLNKKSKSKTSEQEPSKYTSTNANQIGSVIPVVLGRGMIKNPLVSYYGDFKAKPYTEEYGAHAKINARDMLLTLLISLIPVLIMPSNHPVVGASPGTAVDTNNGTKFQLLVSAIVNFIIWLLTTLLLRHLLKTTVQKGFKYYLGWQHIICWSGENFGVKKLWMNVYDSDVEDSTQQGVWSNNNTVAWRNNNPIGIVAHIDDEDMFGGPDEGGGFVGDVRIYLGTYSQPLDSWMVGQMRNSLIPANLQGLTPQYPLFCTAVIPKAYIGKQATIPEMWFEVVNYPNTLGFNYSAQLLNMFQQDVVSLWDKFMRYFQSLPAATQAAYQSYVDAAVNAWGQYIGNRTDANLVNLNTAVDNLYNVWPPADAFNRDALLLPLKDTVSKGVYTLRVINEDLNPAEAIYEILFNKHWGCAVKDVNRVDIDSLLRLGATCEKESLGVSLLINDVKEANEFINKILEHINGVKYDDPKTGKLTFKLVRPDYDVNNLKKFDVSNCVSMEFTRLDWSQVKSSVSASFTDADDKYQTSQVIVHDTAATYITGVHTELQADASYFTTPRNAKIMAEAQLLASAYPLSSVEMECNRYAYDLTIGEPILVSWEPYGIEKQVFRVADIDYGTLTAGAITVTAVEDVFGFESTTYIFSSAIEWTEPEHLPETVSRYKYLEMPYELTFTLDTYIYAFAAMPSEWCLEWHLWRFLSGGYTDTAQTSMWSTVGKMTFGYSRFFSDDYTSGFEIEGIGSNADNLFATKIAQINNDPNSYNNTSTNLLVVDDEIMSFNTIRQLANGHYQVEGIKRGLYDTLPAPHTAESLVFFFDYSLSISGARPVAYQGLVASESLEITTVSEDGTEAFTYSRVEPFTSTRRSEQPSVMANLTFGNEMGTQTVYDYAYPATTVFSGDIAWKFLPRNKYSYPLITSADADISNMLSPNLDVDNVITVDCNNQNFDLAYASYEPDSNGVMVCTTDMTMKWAEFCDAMGNYVSLTNNVTLTIHTKNRAKNLYSFAQYEHSIIYNIPIFVGVVATAADAQVYADSMINSSYVLIPASSYIMRTPVTFAHCPLIFVGTQGQTTGNIMGQDGAYYSLSTTAFRVDGMNSAGSAILHQVDIGPGYIIQSSFSSAVNTVINCYRYDQYTSSFMPYTPYP